jgi:hypothetical protein
LRFSRILLVLNNEHIRQVVRYTQTAYLAMGREGLQKRWMNMQNKSSFLLHIDQSCNPFKFI